MRDQVDFKKSHPDWGSEIEDSLSMTLLGKLRNISQDLGMLSILIFIRMFQSEEKVPTDTGKFLVFVAEKIMKTVKNQDSDQMIELDQKM